jgi:putative transposase
LPCQWFLQKLGLPKSTWHHWHHPSDPSTTAASRRQPAQTATVAEAAAVVAFAQAHPLEGYRALTFMMIDANVAALSPSTVYRLLKANGLLHSWARKPSAKGKGFQQPSSPHQHWHVDITCLNLGGTFFYLCLVLDGYSRSILHHQLAPSMTSSQVQLVTQTARERYPAAHPRIISDNGPQFIAKEFKSFIRLAGLSHVRTSPHYPQSNGKLERFNRTLKASALRPADPSSLPEALSVLTSFLDYYNRLRLHSAVGYITPLDMLQGRQKTIFDSRQQKLAAARTARLSSFHSRNPNLDTPKPTPDLSLSPSPQMSNLA